MKKKTNGIENIFLKYANCSLSENPENFHKIYSEISRYFPMAAITSQLLTEQIEATIKFSQYADTNKSRESLQNPGTVVDTSAFIYVFGEDGDCSKCQSWAERENLYVQNVIQLQKSPKCYECDQQYFIFLLSEIISGKEYSEITSFLNYISRSESLIMQSVAIDSNPSKSKFREELKIVPVWNQLSALSLQLFIQAVMGYCLKEFLIHYDRRRLKKCQRCGKFFISKKVDKRIKFCPSCSQKSRMSLEQRREYQKKYRARKKAEKENQRLEARIKNYMQNLGITREEAIAIIEADSKM